jgi:hypothetical protein
MSDAIFPKENVNFATVSLRTAADCPTFVDVRDAHPRVGLGRHARVGVERTGVRRARRAMGTHGGVGVRVGVDTSARATWRERFGSWCFASTGVWKR